MSKIKKGDEVKVLLGKDRGKSGKVMRVWSKESRVLVEGINLYKRHVRKTGQHEGGIVEIAKPLNTSNVALVCPHCKKPARVRYKVEGTTKIRVCAKCQEAVDVKA